MDKDADSLRNFNQKAINILLGGPLNHNPLTIVMVMYSGEICVLDSNNPKMQHVIPGVIPEGGPYYDWFSLTKKMKHWSTNNR